MSWIEVKNIGLGPVNLSSYQVKVESLNININAPDIVLNAHQYYAIPLPTLNDLFYEGSVELFENNIKVDSVFIPSKFKYLESYGRYPENENSFIFYSKDQTSRQEKNNYPGPWAKLANHVAFSPRDSAPNAIITHNNKFWVFEGWQHIDGSYYNALSNTWMSDDMVHWKLLNTAPPYDPYSAFVSFKNKIWAFGKKTYSSVDGITWTEELCDFPGGYISSVIVRNDTLWFAKAKSIGYSVNGIDWVYTRPGNAPWQPRDWPGFVSFNNSFYFFGGAESVDGSHYSIYHSDVWSSTNGIDWTLVNFAPWAGRVWFSSRVFAGKIWLFGGFDITKESVEYGNMNDVWFTEDGQTWQMLNTKYIWESRHAQFTVSTDSAIYISSGYGSGNLSRLYNDVWKLSLKRPYYFSNEALTITYGQTGDFNELMKSTNVEFKSTDINILGFDSESQYKANHSGAVAIYAKKRSDVSFYGNDTLLSVNIQKKDLIVTANGVKTFGEEDIVYKFSYDGFINGDNELSIDQLPEINTDVIRFSPAGVYNVTLKNGFDNDYNLIFNKGLLTILPGNGPAVFPNPATSYVKVFSNFCDSEQPLFQVELVNQLGERLQTYVLNCLEENSIDLNSLTQGLYSLNIKYNNTRTVKRLVIK